MGEDMPTKEPSNTHRTRTQLTRSKLLAAAETAFARDGFAGAQLTEIALAAGRTKGSVYANFKGKEDLFFALFEERAIKQKERLSVALSKCNTTERRRNAFKQFYVELAQDRNWSLLQLEFKLYAIRHPESTNRLRSAYQSLQRDEKDPVYEHVLGTLTRKKIRSIRTSISSLSPILAALQLESAYEPKRFSDKDVSSILAVIFDALFPFS
jgi:AcrR family transcriptional regulator